MAEKILFVAQNMMVGGIQTSLINLLKKIEKSYEIDLFVFGEGDLLANIPESVHVIKGKTLLRLAATPFKDVLKKKFLPDIFLRCAIMVYVRLIGSDAFYGKLFKKQLLSDKYDCAVSYFNDVPGAYFNRGTNLFVKNFVNADKKVAWIHNDPVKMGFDGDDCEALYADFDDIYCVSGAVKANFDLLCPALREKTRICYNFFDEERISKRADEFMPYDKDYFNLVTVARIDNVQKRIDGIVNVVKRLKDDDVKSFRWYIVGGGDDLPVNKKLAKELGVENLVIFTGEQSNPYPYIKNADVFALYSAYEGHPMVVGEAIVLKTPVLTTNYAAADEQVGEKYGTVCRTDEDFYEVLKEKINGR